MMTAYRELEHRIKLAGLAISRGINIKVKNSMRLIKCYNPAWLQSHMRTFVVEVF